MKQILQFIAQLLGITQQDSYQEVRTQRIPVRVERNEEHNHRFYR